jgi:hypothetical protein
LAAGLHARNRWRLPVLLTGILFAVGRRTVTSWLRAVGVSDDFQDYYYFLAPLGRKAGSVATQLFLLALRTLPLPDRLLVVIDDSPTKRYGPKVEGADIHHNPTPGPADQKYLYGHIWVTLSLALRHPWWGALALPLRARLYVRQKTIPTIPPKRGWRFQTKLELAAHLVEWIASLVKQAGKTVWVVVDGGYTKEPFSRPAVAAGATVIGRLRKDAALRDLPRPLRRGQRRGRGRPRTYGKNRISLAKRAGHRQGWQTIECTAYGNTVVEIIEAFADRATIEQDFHDVKEVWGAGQQQVRNIWTNVAVYHLNLWMHTLVELWAWNRPHKELCDRRDSPGDDPERRPSHADRRKALRKHILRNELSAITAVWSLPRKILGLARRLMALAA